MTRILIVEDEESFSDPLSYSLRKEGYEVAVADTGTDGLRIFSAHGADLVVAGGYGHARLREWAFGGVTRDLLSRCPVCCLLSH